MFAADDDYEIVKGWWEHHAGSAVPLAALPALGAVAFEEGGRDLAASWLYMDNSRPVALMCWTVANPEATGISTVKAIAFLTDYLCQMAIKFGYNLMMTTCGHRGLARFYERSGFTVAAQNETTLLKVLEPKTTE